jgi:hypothetical protein
MWHRCFLSRSFLVLVLSGSWLLAAPGAAELEGQRRRLGDLPITLYPDFVVQDSSLPAFVNSHARPQDAVVISWRDALKGSFRVPQLGITRGQVWVYVPHDMDLAQQGWRNLQGISGIVFVPEAGLVTAATVNGLVETASALKCTLIVGVESRRAIPLFNVPTLSRPAQVLTIYDNARLRDGAGSYRRYVDRMTAEARGVNPGIQIEVAVATARGAQATKAVYETLVACSEVADRVGIFCNSTTESDESLRLLFCMLRGDEKR